MNTSPETRASLILRLQGADDSVVWNEFVSLYQSVIYRTARKQGLCHDDAVEVTQEVLARVSRSIDAWEPDPARGSFRGWLYRITKNLSVDFLRKSRRRPSTGNGDLVVNQLDEVSERKASDESNDFDLQFERQVFRAAAKKIENDFAASTWSAFWKTAVDGDSIESVASDLKISRGAIYIARSRVMARLKKQVKQMLNETMGE